MPDLPPECFRCPECRSDGSLNRSTARAGGSLSCVTCGNSYPLRDGVPILISRSNALFDLKKYEVGSLGGIYRKTRVRFPSASVNLSRGRILREMGAALRLAGATRVLLVGSGRQREGIRRQLLGADPADMQIVCCDVDISADVDLFCDAQSLPFIPGYFDALITTAVLEHVLYPEKAAAEFARVVKLGGLLYSELPFLQCVHEGAYDFTRYTMSGHKRLFHEFGALNSGMVAGPGTALVWALEHFAASVCGTGMMSRVGRGVTRLAFFWLKYADILLSKRPAALDACSCTFLYGRRREGIVSDQEIVEGYAGAGVISHV